MNICTHILNTGGRLNELKEAIDKASQEAIKKISSKIPVDNVDIVIADLPKDPSIIKNLGVGGYALTKNFIMIPLDPDFPKIKQMIKTELPRTIAHELYHCLREYTFDKKPTLLESFINEGLADHFEVEISGKPAGRWTKAVDRNQIDGLMEKAKEEFDHASAKNWKWFYGSIEENIPQRALYSIGYKLVKDYLARHPDKKPSTLYKLPSEEFVK